MTIKVYKLTTQDNKTRKGQYNECTWGPGVTHRAKGGGGLCSDGCIHAYLSPELAVLLNPIHANIPNPKLWECSVPEIARTDNDLKVGAISLTTDREIPLPAITTRQRVIFGILCAEKVQEEMRHRYAGNEPWKIKYRNLIVRFNEWATKYKAGDADAAASAAAYAAYAASAAYAAAYAARSATAASAAYATAASAASAASGSSLPLKVLAEDALSERYK